LIHDNRRFRIFAKDTPRRYQIRSAIELISAKENADRSIFTDLYFQTPGPSSRIANHYLNWTA